jgi:hypothetical protein
VAFGALCCENLQGFVLVTFLITGIKYLTEWLKRRKSFLWLTVWGVSVPQSLALLTLGLWWGRTVQRWEWVAEAALLMASARQRQRETGQDQGPAPKDTPPVVYFLQLGPPPKVSRTSQSRATSWHFNPWAVWEGYFMSKP